MHVQIDARDATIPAKTRGSIEDHIERVRPPAVRRRAAGTDREMLEGPSLLWATVIAITNAIIFAWLGYMIWKMVFD